MKLLKKLKLPLLGIFAIFFGALLFNVADCSALSLAFSPMRQEKVLVPGSTEEMTLKLFVDANEQRPTNYELDVSPFSTDEENRTIPEAKGNYSEIVNWVTISENDKKGTIQPGESKNIHFTINVPEDAPAGGQYFGIVITALGDEAGITENQSMLHPITTEVAGETRRQGEIDKLEVPSFLFSGKITGSASVKNQGNVHSNVKHILKVFPLFGNEELYTNEEEPQENMIMPEATRFTTISWDETPSMGVFRVVYTAEFEGVKSELSKVVIICPIWLLVIIFAFLIVLAYSIFTRGKHKGSKAQTAHSAHTESA